MRVLAIAAPAALSRRIRADGHQVSQVAARHGLARVSFTPDVVVVFAAGGRPRIGLDTIRDRFPHVRIVLAGRYSEPQAKKAYQEGATAVVPSDAVERALETLNVERGDAPAPGLPPALERLPWNVVADFHDPVSGRLDAERVARAYGVSLAAIARAIDLAPSTLTRRPTAPAAQDGLRELEYAWAGLGRLMGDDRIVRAWLNAADPDLEGDPPLSLLTGTSADALATYVKGILSGQPS